MDPSVVSPHLTQRVKMSDHGSHHTRDTSNSLQEHYTTVKGLKKAYPIGYSIFLLLSSNLMKLFFNKGHSDMDNRTLGI